jgi:hypothetical protein
MLGHLPGVRDQPRPRVELATNRSVLTRGRTRKGGRARRTAAVPGANRNTAFGLFLWLGREQKRIAFAPTRICRLRCLRFSNIFCVDRHDTCATTMCRDHHSRGLILAYAEFRLQDRNDELARRVVVIDQDDFVKTGSFDLNLIFDRGLCYTVIHRHDRSCECRDASGDCFESLDLPLDRKS